MSNAELERLGLNHNMITGARASLYTAFAKTEEKLTWESMASIETAALVKAKMDPGLARATVDRAIEALKEAALPDRLEFPGEANSARR